MAEAEKESDRTNHVTRNEEQSNICESVGRFSKHIRCHSMLGSGLACPAAGFGTRLLLRRTASIGVLMGLPEGSPHEVANPSS